MNCKHCDSKETVKNGCVREQQRYNRQAVQRHAACRAGVALAGGCVAWGTRDTGDNQRDGV